MDAPTTQSSDIASPPTPSTEPEIASAPNDPKPDDLSSLGDFKFYNAPQDFDGRPVELPPNFLDPTAADLRAAQDSLSARARSLNERPLMTQKLRDEKETNRRNRWPTVTIRVRFASRMQLEKVFPSNDHIKSVYRFVRGCLRVDVRAHKFVLYQTPPRRDLKVSDPATKDKDLFDLQLVPSSILWFRFLDEELNLDTPDFPPPLHPEILSRAIDLPRPPPDLTPEQPSQTSSSSSGIKVGGPGEKKIPKWLLAGLKKK
ncbi:hypothetical protein BD410DRAFT_895719 [Rickenella mellea]|uniref:UBX domain-containing protein n=1 Tax=Rickenella mellea TaxID=50990 RepID=A0A4Y7QF99_9AGAM|nr:hypothetical protein BD410DRAFT_895719 [Rickenella mellea]